MRPFSDGDLLKGDNFRHRVLVQTGTTFSSSSKTAMESRTEHEVKIEKQEELMADTPSQTSKNMLVASGKLIKKHFNMSQPSLIIATASLTIRSRSK